MMVLMLMVGDDVSLVVKVTVLDMIVVITLFI